MKLIIESNVIVAFIIFLLNSPIAHAEHLITVTAVGDVRISKRMIQSEIGTINNLSLNGDIVIANYEGTISDHSFSNQFLLTMPSESVGIIMKIGFSVLSLVNNHCMDLGKENYESTIDKLLSCGFNIVDEADRDGTKIVINKKTVRILGFSFCSKYNNVLNIEQVIRHIKSLNDDIIIVSAHMGGEGPDSYRIPKSMEYYNGEARGDVMKFAHACIDAGADLIIGHGPHLIRQMEIYKNKAIFYSLGNFLFDYPGATAHENIPTIAVKIELDHEGNFVSTRVVSYLLQKGVPVIDPYNKGYSLLKNLSEVSNSNTHMSFEYEAIVNALH